MKHTARFYQPTSLCREEQRYDLNNDHSLFFVRSDKVSRFRYPA